jgi:hypothetical protein
MADFVVSVFYTRQSDTFLSSANFSTQHNASKGNPFLTPEIKPMYFSEVLLTPSLKMTLFIFTSIYTSISHAVSDSITSYDLPTPPSPAKCGSCGVEAKISY